MSSGARRRETPQPLAVGHGGTKHQLFVCQRKHALPSVPNSRLAAVATQAATSEGWHLGSRCLCSTAVSGMAMRAGPQQHHNKTKGQALLPSLRLSPQGFPANHRSGTGSRAHASPPLQCRHRGASPRARWILWLCSLELRHQGCSERSGSLQSIVGSDMQMRSTTKRGPTLLQRT